MKTIERKIFNWTNENKWNDYFTKSFSCRDSVKIAHGVATMYLHGHAIFTINFKNNTVLFSFCGWQTNTTKSRINAFLSAFAVGYVKQKNYNLIFVCNGTETAINAYNQFEVENNAIKMIM